MQVKIIVFLFSFYLVFLSAESIESHLSFQGYTGVINTPNTEVIQEETVSFHFNNQFDTHLLRDESDNSDSKEEYTFGIGFLPSLEMVGRLVESEKGGVRDLSANIKYKLPYSVEYLPNIAVGIQDIGGSFTFYRNSYVVLDKEIGQFRTSFGYGVAGEGRRGKRMDGFFTGLEVEATDWLSLMAEHDGDANHLALRLEMPKKWLSSFSLETIISQNLTESDTSFAVNLSIPLFDKQNILESKVIDSNINNKKIESVKTVEKNKITTAMGLQNRLVEFGFEDVRIGKYDDVIYVECENSIFEHNDLDALGYIIGTIVHSRLNYSYYNVTLLKSGIQTLSLGGTANSFREYIKTPSIKNRNIVKDGLTVTREFDTSKVKFLTKKANSSLFKPRVELSLGLITTVGTEVGVFDYLASLRTNLYTTLYDGLIVSALYESPFMHSSNFDKDKIYSLIYEDNLDSRLVNVNLHQTVHFDNLLNTTSIGQFYTDYKGVINQTNIASSSGNHALNLKVGVLRERDKQREIYLGEYRYFYEPFDLYSEIIYGQYWNQESGITLQLKRFFGETAIAFYYKNVGSQYIGVQLSLPLTLQKIAKSSSLGQIKGKKDFSYGLRTTFREDDGSNRLKPSGGIIPKVDFELKSYYLNRDRVSQAYIKENIGQMREIYINYK